MRCVPALALLVAGCVEEEPRLEGPHYQYVMSELRMPTNNNLARAYGLDLNGDKTVDNQLGMVFGVLEGTGLGVAGTTHEALLRGGTILLADFQTPSFETSELSGLTTYLGGDPTPAPCLDPARLETCGQHLLGQGQFSIDPGSESDHAVAPIAESMFTARVGILPVEIATDVSTLIRIDLHGSRVHFTEVSEGHVTGVLGGVIVQSDLDGVVIPQIAMQMDRIVGSECPQAGGSGSCGCVNGGRADLLQDYFDANDNCEITLTEVANNSIVKSLLSPDVTVNGEKGLSFGVGVELVPATY